MTARVVVLLNSLGVGGAEVFAIDCAAALDRARFHVSIATLRGEETWLAGVIDRAGLPRVRLRRRELAGYLERERVDVVQTHHTLAGVFARVVGKAVSVPAIVCTEQVVVNELPTRYRFLNDATIGLADAHVCITEGVRASLAEEGVWSRRLRPESVRVIVNGVDVATIEGRVAAAGDKRKELGIAPGDFVIGTAGRLAEQKAQKDLIAALPLVLRDVPRARVVMAGSGPLEHDLRAQAAALGLADRVHLIGNRSDLFEVMTTFDAFAFPSIYEGLGVVLLRGGRRRRADRRDARRGRVRRGRRRDGAARPGARSRRARVGADRRRPRPGRRGAARGRHARARRVELLDHELRAGVRRLVRRAPRPPARPDAARAPRAGGVHALTPTREPSRIRTPVVGADARAPARSFLRPKMGGTVLVKAPGRRLGENMKTLKVSIVAALVVAASLVTGCGTQFAATELNANVPMGAQRPASSVEVFASEPPTRPHVDVRLIEAQQQLVDPDASLVDQLRAEAGREGCDAIYVKSMFAGTPKQPQRMTATCVVYTAPSSVAAAPVADAPSVGAVVGGPSTPAPVAAH